METFVLASGSKGNMTYIKTQNKRFFIDAGISIKNMISKMNAYGENVREVDTLFLTHEHLDHISGLKSLLKLGIIRQVILSKGTYDALNDEIKELIIEKTIIEPDQPFLFFGLKVTPILLSHDANEPTGFIFEENNKKIVLLTDTGYVDESYIEVLKGADLYILESNHDPHMLLTSKRPFSLKHRILGEKGHLSNEDAIKVLNKIVTKKTVWVVAHMSEDCNTILEVEKMIVDKFYNPLLLDVYYASQEALPGIKI